MRTGRIGHVLRIITCALSVTSMQSLGAQQAERPNAFLEVNPEWVDAFAAEAYGMNRFGPEILERGRNLYQNGIRTQNCKETLIGAALIAHAWISIGTGDALAELDKLDITSCGTGLPHAAYKIGAAFFEFGEYSRAIPFFEDAGRYERWQVPASTAVGTCEQRLGNLERAAEAYAFALKSTKKNLSPLLVSNLSALYLQLGALNEARKTALLGIETWGDGKKWLEKGFTDELPDMLTNTLLFVGIAQQDSAEVERAFRKLGPKGWEDPDYLRAFIAYALFTGSPALIDGLESTCPWTASDSLSAADAALYNRLPEQNDPYLLLFPPWRHSGFNLPQDPGWSMGWGWLLAAKNLGILSDFNRSTVEEPDFSKIFTHRIRHWPAVLGILWITLILTISIRMVRSHRSRLNERLQNPPELTKAEMIDLIQSDNLSTEDENRLMHFWASGRASSAVNADTLRKSWGLTESEWHILELTAQGIEAKSIARSIQRSPGHVLNTRSQIRKQLGLEPGANLASWWHEQGLPLLGIVLVAWSYLLPPTASAVNYTEWSSALQAEDTLAAARHASAFWAELDGAIPTAEGAALYTETILLTSDIAGWESHRAELDRAILRDTVAAKQLLGPLRWMYMPWRERLETEAQRVLGEAYTPLTARGWWLLLGPQAPNKRALPGHVLAHAPRFQDVTAWISKRDVTRLKFYLQASAVAGILIVFALNSRLSRAAKAVLPTPAPETAPVPEFHSALVTAIRAGKPLPLRKALFAACAFESGHTFVQPQGGYAEEILLLNERERLLLHLIAARVSALECAAVLGCTEPYVYAMRSRIRAKLSLDSETTLEDTLQRWETSFW